MTPGTRLRPSIKLLPEPRHAQRQDHYAADKEGENVWNEVEEVDAA